MALNQESLERLWQHIIARLGRKVDKEEGKTLTDNNFTDDDRIKLDAIAQPDWFEDDTSSYSYIKNKTHGITKQKDFFLLTEANCITLVDTFYYATGDLLYNPNASLNGETATVCIDGIDYICSPIRYEDDDTKFGFGSKNIVANGRSLYPFELIIQINTSNNTFTYELYHINQGKHTFSVRENDIINVLHEKYLPETAVKYIEDPILNKMEQIIPLTTVTINSNYVVIGQFDPLISGNNYKVILNDTEYICKARSVGDRYVLIGNGTVFGDGNPGNNEPFSCESYSDGRIYLNVTSPGTYSITILKIANAKRFNQPIDTFDLIDKTSELKYSISISNGELVITQKTFDRYLFQEGQGFIKPMTLTKQSSFTGGVTDEKIIFSYTGTSYTCGLLITDEAIDLTNYKTLIYDVEVTDVPTGNYALRVGLYNAIPTVGNTSSTNAYSTRILSATEGRVLIKIDVENLSIAKYIAVMGAGNATIHNIYLKEK